MVRRAGAEGSGADHNDVRRGYHGAHNTPGGRPLEGNRPPGVRRPRSPAVGRRPNTVTLPLVMGCDPSGTVVAVGGGADPVMVGDRVAAFGFVGCGTCAHCAAGDHRRCIARKMLGVQCWGGYAEYLRLPATSCVAVPTSVSFADATVIARHFPLAFGECSLGALRRDEWALVMGAAGGLGSALVQVAKSLGARVIAAAGADARVETAVALGADAGVNYRRLDLDAEVKRITAGHGADVVFENIGDPALWP